MSGETDTFESWVKLFGRLFDSSAAQVALLNLEGVIVETNKAWREFGRRHGLALDYETLGQNYLKICETAAEAGDQVAKDAYIGLLEVLHTRRPKFTMVYPCNSPTRTEWYRMWVEPQSPQMPLIVVAHYPIETAIGDPQRGHESLGAGLQQNVRHDAAGN